MLNIKNLNNNFFGYFRKLISQLRKSIIKIKNLNYDVKYCNIILIKKIVETSFF